MLLGGDTGSRAAVGVGVFDGVSASGSPLAQVMGVVRGLGDRYRIIIGAPTPDNPRLSRP